MNEQTKFPIIRAEGTPYEIGFTHGAQGKPYVLSSIRTYQKMFEDFANLSWTDAKTRAKQYIEPIRAYDGELLEEMQGLADGAGVTLADILALNARSEVILMQPHLTGGCTSVAVLPELTEQKCTFLAQNWDWKPSQSDSCIVLQIRQKNKPSIQMITEAGIIGKIGMNSAGLGVCLNALGMPGTPEGVPLHIILRGILNAETVSDAIGAIIKCKNACPANYLIAHKEGEAADVETTPTDFDVFYADDDFLTHANHFTSMRLKFDDLNRRFAPDTYMRDGRAVKLIRRANGAVNRQTLERLLTDHHGYPDAICRHEDPKDPPGFRMGTVFSVIMNLTDQQMYLAKGAPCESAYALYENWQ